MNSQIFIRRLVVALLLVLSPSGFAQTLDLISNSNEPVFVTQNQKRSGSFERAGRLKVYHRSLSTLVDQIRRQRDIPEIRVKLFEDIEFTIITE